MGRSKSTGRSPAKKSSGRTPARHTTPRKKSKTPSRKGKSPAPKRGRSRSISKSRATTPKKSVKRTPSKTSKSPSIKSKSSSIKSSSPKRTPRGRPRSRSHSQSTASTLSSGRRTPTIGQKIQNVAHVIEHKIATPVEAVASKLRSRRAAFERQLNSGPVTSYASRRAPVVQSWCHRARAFGTNAVRNAQRRLRWTNVKRHFKKNWRRYAIVALIGATAYYSYHNKKHLEKLYNEQSKRLSEHINHQFRGDEGFVKKYITGWFDESSKTTQTPPTIPPRTADQHQVPQPQHHATQTTGR